MMEQLGQLRFRMRKSGVRFLAWVVVVLLPVAVFAITSRGSLDGVTGNEIAISILLLLVIAALLLDFLLVRIEVYEKGLVSKSLLSQQIMPFSPYMQLYIRRWRYGVLGLRFGSFTELLIEDEHGHHRIGASFRHNEKTAAVIENYLFGVSMHMLNQIYDAGEVLHFGAVQLSRNHIAVGEQHLMLEDLGKAVVSGGHLKLYAKNRHGRARLLAEITVPIEKIANFRLFCRFVGLNDLGMTQQMYRVRRYLLI